MGPAPMSHAIVMHLHRPSGLWGSREGSETFLPPGDFITGQVHIFFGALAPGIPERKK